MTIFQKVSIISFGDRAVGNTIKLRQSPGPGPGPAPRDTSLFRERGRTAGVCRVESTTGEGQKETELIHKAGTSEMMFPPFLNASTNRNLNTTIL